MVRIYLMRMRITIFTGVNYPLTVGFAIHCRSLTAANVLMGMELIRVDCANATKEGEASWSLLYNIQCKV